jgi:hypothetical protein
MDYAFLSLFRSFGNCLLSPNKNMLIPPENSSGRKYYGKVTGQNNETFLPVYRHWQREHRNQ